MKTLMLWLALAGVASAEDWKMSDGKIYKDVTVIKVEVDAVTILDSDGGARIPLVSLPADLQKRFGYDPTKAAIAAKQHEADEAIALKQLEDAKKQETAQREQEEERAKIDKEQASAMAIISQAKAEEAAIEKAKEESTLNSVVRISGTVSQKTSDGYLIRAEIPDRDMETADVCGIYKAGDGSLKPVYEFNNVSFAKSATIFLTTTRDMVDGDTLDLLAYPIGESNYTTVLGADATVRKYKELHCYSASQFNEELRSGNQWNPGSMNP